MVSDIYIYIRHHKTFCIMFLAETKETCPQRTGINRLPELCGTLAEFACCLGYQTSSCLKKIHYFSAFRGEVFLTGWVVPSTYRFLYLWNGAMQCTQTKEGTTPDH